MSNEQLSQGVSRRQFLTGALATAGLLALAGNARAGMAADSAKADASSKADAASAGKTADLSTDTINATYDADTSAATKGGTFKYYITNPVAIEPFGAEENQGYQVMDCLFDPLLAWDYSAGKLAPLAAESYEVNDTADKFTFHLRKDATFHNGNPVTAKDFVYSWNRICNPNFKPSPSSIGYKIAQVKGYDEMMAGTADSLDIEAPDDYTFVVNLKAPFAEFPKLLTDQALAPVPAGSTDTEADFQAFRVHPIGNGPFQMDGDWVDGQFINVKPFDGYWGDKPLLDQIAFTIFKDDTTAWTEFQAGNIDFVNIPSGQFTVTKQQYGEAGKDGYVANPGAQVLSGAETSIFYLLINNEDDVMSNADLRRGISNAINRQALADVVFEGTRTPADNMLMPAVPGYEESKWDNCPAQPDLDKAKEYLDKAGYPADANGNRGLTLSLKTNVGQANETAMTMIQADLKAVGIEASVDTQEWAAYVDAAQSGDYQMGRMGWVISVPQQYTILHDLFYTGGGNNTSKYSNPDFDVKIDEAVTIVDDDKRLQAFIEANKIVAADFPVAPLLFYRHNYLVSKRVNNFFYDPGTFCRMTRVWLTA